MTPAERLLKEQKIKALQLAKMHLPQHPYVCNALLNVGYANPDLMPAVSGLLRYIQSSLGGVHTLGSWQTAQGLNPFNAPAIPGSRAAWIDWMIDCLKEDLENDTV